MANTTGGKTGVPEIDKLDLQPDVAQKALQLKKAAPNVVFTSGRRTIQEQAHAMATNVVKQRDWIAQTYRQSATRQKLQQWVDTHPQAVTVDAIAAGLEQVLNSLPEVEQLRISKHLTGRAFDVSPGSVPREAIKALQPKQFLTKEGNLVIWHVGF